MDNKQATGCCLMLVCLFVWDEVWSVCALCVYYVVLCVFCVCCAGKKCLIHFLTRHLRVGRKLFSQSGAGLENISLNILF